MADTGTIWADDGDSSRGLQGQSIPDPSSSGKKTSSGGASQSKGAGTSGGGRQRQGRRIGKYGQNSDSLDKGDANEEFDEAQGERVGAADVNSSGQFLLAAPRTRKRKGMLTQVGDALQLCRDMVTTQFQKAQDMKDVAMPNENISGDAFTRMTIQTLLPNDQQRQLFLETALNPDTWPRLKPIFGAPPYHFLLPNDAGVLRATGMSKGRSNMTYETANPMMNITAITGFGEGQLQDQHERQFRVMPARLVPMEDSDILPFRLSEYRDPDNVMMHVKVPKRSRVEKARLLGSAILKSRLFFPQPGEKLTLRETGRLMALINQKVQTSTEVVVKRIVPRAEHAATAFILVSIA